MSAPTGRDPLLLPAPRAALLRRLRELTVDDLHALDAAVRALRDEKPYAKRVHLGFWLAWYEGPRLAKEQGAEVGDLFVQVMVAIAGGLTGLDVERYGARLGGAQQGGFLGDLRRLMRPEWGNQRLQNAAIGLIQDAVAPWDPRLALVACWNVACSAVLRTHLAPEIVDVLESAWRRALGEPPA